MPPKPKGKDDKKKGEEQAVDDGAERELVEKELVISYLKSKLGRYQEFGDRLQVDNIKLNEELETQKLNLRDINEFLTNELKARSLTTSALEAKVFELNHLMDELRKSHEDALAKLGRDKDRQIETLQSQIRDFEKKARTTQEFLDRKDQLEAELAHLKDTLAKKVKEYDQQLTDMDRQRIQDREKWKRETAQKIKETKIQMMKLTDNQLEMTTKRTIMENEQMSIELSYQSRQTEKLLAKNNVLVQENSDLRRQLELSKQTEEELAKRNNVYQKTIKSLLTKLKEQGLMQDESGDVVSELELHISDLEAALHLAQLQVEELGHQLRQSNAKLSDQSAQLETWGSRHDQAAQFLMACLEDVKEKIVTVERPEGGGGGGGGGGGYGGDDGASPWGVPEPPLSDLAVLPGRLDDLNAEQRARVLEHLLERLHVFTKAAQLEAATTGVPLGGGAGARGGGGGGGGEAAGISLPHISPYPRRNAPISQSLTSSYPTSQGSMGLSSTLTSDLPPGSRLSTFPAASSASAQRGGGSRGSPVPGSGAAGLSSVPEHDGASAAAAAMAAGPGELPPVDDLLAKVMSDVRPWGKKSDVALTSSMRGVFVKKGPTTRVTAR